jgi:intracellular sulfur oxidation DsrE/DsrF family protein
MDYSQPSDLISKLSKEIAKMFTDSVVGLDERGKIVSNHLFQSRKELIEDFAERIRLKDLDKMIKNKNKIKSKDVNVTNQLVGYLLPLLRVNELKIKSKIEPKTMELANYIIQIYICINTLARHATTNDANLMLNTYNEQMVSISISLPLPSSSSGQLCSFHDQLFVSNLTINFFVKKIPKEIISIILEYDQISGERLLESGVEDVIYQRASLFKKQNENNF